MQVATRIVTIATTCNNFEIDAEGLAENKGS